jgi:hypothetical protein
MCPRSDPFECPCFATADPIVHASHYTTVQGSSADSAVWTIAGTQSLLGCRPWKVTAPQHRVTRVVNSAADRDEK